MHTHITELRKKANALNPILQVGKAGITDALITELRKLLHRHKLVKVKLLKSFIDQTPSKEAAKELSEKADGKIIAQTGFMVCLYRGKL
ncbi:MAG: YhbY family RNA-binding protein [Nanoarchaeota archaeon]